MNKSKSKVKRVKGWAIVDNKNKLIAFEKGKAKPKRFTIGTWQFFIDDWSSTKALPCIIEYKLPTQSKK